MAQQHLQKMSKKVLLTILAGGLSLGMVACSGIDASPVQHPDYIDSKDRVRFVHVFDNDEVATYRREIEVFGPYLSARYAVAERDYGKAAKLFQKVLKRHPDSATILGRAFMNALHAGRRQETLSLANRIVGTHESAGVSRFVIAANAIETGQYDDVFLLIEAPRNADAESEDFGNGILLEPFVLAWAYAGKGDVESALAQLTPLAEEPGAAFFNGLALYHMALIQSQLGVAGADDNFVRALDLFGGSVRMARAYAHHIAVNQSVSDAITFLDNFGERYDIKRLADEEKKALLRSKSPGLLIKTPIEGVTEAVYLASASLAAERAFGPALLYLNLTLFCDDDHAVALMMLAELENFRDNYQAALDAFLRVPEQSEHYVEARVKAAYVLADMKRQDGAIRLLDQTVQQNKGRDNQTISETELLLAKAGMLRNNEQFAPALEIYNQLLARAEKSSQSPRAYWSLYYMRGMSLERLGRWEEAEADLLKALDLNPGSALVMNYLGYSWVDQGMHLNEGRQLIEQAVELRPRDGFIVDSLGWVLYKMGEYDDAAQILARAVSLEPGDPTIADHYGDALWRADRKIEAQFQWRHALELDPTDELRAKLQLKLSMGLDHAMRIESHMERDG